MKKKLVVADLSNIEGRVLAYLAGEKWKLDAFRAYDAGTGPDVYNLTAVSIVGGDPYNVPKTVRNVFGKVPDLAGGYEGGVGAYQTFAKAYGIQMADHWDTIQQKVHPDLIVKARDNLGRWGRRQMEEMEISETEWLASESAKLAWRARHPVTRKLWYALKDGATRAIQNPGTVFKAGPHLKFKVVRLENTPWLLLRLPSGRFLTYYRPIITDNGSISYEGYGTEDGKSTARVWTRLFAYGGKFAENACQALSADILKHNMPAIEEAGYEGVLTVHDEEVTETPDTPEYNADHLSYLLSRVPDWAPGLPLAAAGFEAYRYKKE